MMTRPEILSPCGSSETLFAVLRTGCDAVYLGGEGFSARQNAVNFTREQLSEAVCQCHVRGVKVYQAINTVITDSQLEECVSAVRYACEIGIDGLITQDLALAEIVKSCCPELEIHASTQMTLHTARGAMFAKKLGFSRIVAARELPAEIIEELCRLPVEVEVFVHGALCMSVSGQCYMSAVIGSRSANRGLCAQACRLPALACSENTSADLFHVERSDRSDLSLKDMSHVEHLSEMEKKGVTSFKIEGRMKRPEYAAAATDAVKKAMNGEEYDSLLLEKVFSRSGFTDGYYTSQLGGEMFGSRQHEDVVSSLEALPQLRELYRREFKRSRLSISAHIRKNKPLTISAADENGLTVSVTGSVPEKAKNRSTTAEDIKKQLSKLGDTIYELTDFSCEIDDGLYCAASELNSLRRDLCEKMDKARYKYYTQKTKFTNISFDFVPTKRVNTPEIRISAHAHQLKKVDVSEISLCICPLWEVGQLLENGFPTEKLAAELPRFTFDESRDFAELERLTKIGLKHILCTNYAHISMGFELGLVMHGGLGLNVTNSLALRALKREGLADCTASFELKSSQINALSGELDLGIIGYGRLSLMLTANCPVRSAIGCGKCGGRGYIKDRTGRRFPVRCNKTKEYAEILNSEVLYIGDIMDKFRTVSFVQLNFEEESLEEIAGIIRDVPRGTKPRGGFTRGLYNRGIL